MQTRRCRLLLLAILVAVGGTISQTDARPAAQTKPTLTTPSLPSATNSQRITRRSGTVTTILDRLIGFNWAKYLHYRYTAHFMDANIDYSHRTSFEKAFSMKDDKYMAMCRRVGSTEPAQNYGGTAWYNVYIYLLHRSPSLRRNEVVPLNGSPPSFNCKLAKDLGKENVAKKPPASTNLVPVSLNSPASEVADQGTFHANPAAPFEPTVPDIVITDVDDHPSDLGTTSPIYSAQAVPQELPNNSFNESDGEAAPPNPSQDTPLPPAVAEVESEQRLPPTKPPRRNYLNKKNPVPVDVNSPPGPIQANQEGPTPRKENGSTSADFGTTSSNQSTYVDQKNDGKSSAWPDKNDTDWSEDDSQLTDDEFWEDVTSQFPAPPSVGRPHRAQFQPQLAVPI